MDESQLKQDLQALGARPIPNLPDSFNESVWTKIRTERRAAMQEGWLDALVSMLSRPRWASAALIITLLVGANLGRVLAHPQRSHSHGHLGLEVFAGNAPTLPSTLLGQSR